MTAIEASSSGTFRTILVLVIIWWFLRMLLRRQAARGPQRPQQQATTDRRRPGEVRIEPSSLGGRTRPDDASRSNIIDADFEEVK
ncbi:MAG TPA: hypothetical protein PLN54_10635 [Flavobacteriales bacterium]|nr:hypothetical protein [Flavobacteriales bacterium]